MMKVIVTVGVAITILVVVLVIRTSLYSNREARIPLIKDIVIDKMDAAQRLAGAIRIQTVSRANAPMAGDAFLQFHAYLEKTFPAIYHTLTRETVNGYSLLYTWMGKDPKLQPILLLAHIDVVPVVEGSEMQWTYPPFEGRIADGYIWGRGSLDMKHSLMGIMEAIEYLIKGGFIPDRTVYLAFGHDEEIGGFHGAKIIGETLKARGVKAEFTLDEGSPLVEGLLPGITKSIALIGLSEKGYVTLRLTAVGPGGHGSMPSGDSAIGKLTRAVYRLDSRQMPAKIISPISDMFTALVTEMPFDLRMVIANQWLFGPLLIHRLEASPATNATVRTTTAVTVINGGNTYNVIPTEATAVGTFRILPGDTIEKVVDHVKKVIDDPTIKLEKTGAGEAEPARVSEVDSLAYNIIKKTIYQTIPEVFVAPSLTVTSTDSGHYRSVSVNNYRFVPVRIGPDDVKRIHGINERIGVNNYAEIIKFYVQLMRNFNLNH
jgi:carboxypeptidase PM20D1